MNCITHIAPWRRPAEEMLGCRIHSNPCLAVRDIRIHAWLCIILIILIIHSNPCLAVYYSYYSYYSHVFMQFHHFHRFHSSPYTTTRANARWSAAESIRIRTLASRRQAGAMPNPFEFAGALPNPFEFLSLSSIRIFIRIFSLSAALE